MPRIKKNKSGRYHVNGKSYKHLVGSRVMVWNGSAYKTSYGKDALKKKDIKKNKWGRLVSVRKSRWGKKKRIETTKKSWLHYTKR